jgi:phosphate transport system protein
MTKKKEEAIIDCVKSFEEMADLVLIQLTLLEKYMLLNDRKEMNNILSRIEENENKIDEFEVIISDKFISSIILFQPVASDIRKLNSIYRISINLERIGDVVLNIVQSIESIKETAEYEAMQDVLMNMLVSGVTMVEKSLLSFLNNDDSYAEWTIKNDEIVDMERIADHATNIAEASIYSMQGTDIRHKGIGTHHSETENI